MRGNVINLIVFCVFALFVSNNSVTEGHSVKDYLRGLLTIKQIGNIRHGILPGTVWCGLGDIARDDSDLGTYAEMDQCCRAHDGCEDYITSKSTRYGLYNNHICRGSLCECELQFFNCLKQVRGFYPYMVRKIYFKSCKRCFRTFYDPQECINERLDIIDEIDRKGRRVFCAKFDRNPKWGYRFNTTSLGPISTKFSWDDDDEYTQLISHFGSEEDKKYFNENDNYDEDY